MHLKFVWNLFEISLNSFNQSALWLVKLFPKKTIRVPWLSAREGINYFHPKVPPKFYWRFFEKFKPVCSLTGKTVPRRQSECPDYLQGNVSLYSYKQKMEEKFVWNFSKQFQSEYSPTPKTVSQEAIRVPWLSAREDVFWGIVRNFN